MVSYRGMTWREDRLGGLEEDDPVGWRPSPRSRWWCLTIMSSTLARSVIILLLVTSPRWSLLWQGVKPIHPHTSPKGGPVRVTVLYFTCIGLVFFTFFSWFCFFGFCGFPSCSCWACCNCCRWEGNRGGKALPCMPPPSTSLSGLICLSSSLGQEDEEAKDDEEEDEEEGAEEDVGGSTSICSW